MGKISEHFAPTREAARTIDYRASATPVALPYRYRSLLMRPSPAQGESQWGFWLRVAHENGLERPQWLLAPGERWRTAMVRVCSECLRSPVPLWRDVWQAREGLWCSDHQRWLCDVCPACQRQLRWNRVRFLECTCGFDLRAASCGAVDPDVAEVVGNGGPPVAVLRLLGALAQHGLAGKIGKKSGRATVAEARPQLLAGAQLVGDWPEKFYGLLDHLRGPSPETGVAQLLSQALPGLADLPDQISDPDWRLRLAGAINAYCARTQNSRAPILGRSSVLHCRPMTLKELASKVGRGTTKVALAADRQGAGIRGVRVTANGRRRRVVAEQDVALISADLDEAIALKRAGRLLDLPVSRIRALVQAGMIGSIGQAVRHADIVVIARLASSAPIATRVMGAQLQVRVALRNWIQLDDTAAFVRALQQGEILLQQTGCSGPLGSRLVSESAVQMWVPTQRARDTNVMSLEQAAGSMALKQEVVLSLVRRGLIRAVKGRRGGRLSWLISYDDLAVFQARCVPLAELAARAGVASRKSLEWAQSKGLRVLCGPRIDGSRQYFVERTAAAAA